MLSGEQGPAVALSMRIITELGRIRGATELVDIDSVHIDGCIFYGQAGLDFAQKLVALGGQVRVPTTVNVGSVDLIHPHLILQNTERERWVAEAARMGRVLQHDFSVAMADLPAEGSRWKPLRGDENADATDYPVLDAEAAAAFRSLVRAEIGAFTRATYPSLQDSDKPEPPADWEG